MVSLLKNRAQIIIATLLVSVLLCGPQAFAADGNVEVEKRVDRERAKVGELLTFSVDVVNQSDEDYLPSNSSGGVLFEDIPPAGFKLIEGSARIRTSAGLDIQAEVSRKGKVLVFGRTSPQGPVGLALRKGQRLQLRYRMVVESGVQPERVYSNRAQARSASGVSLGGEVKADVRIEAEAEFDQGLVLGRVYCDSNGDGQQDADEQGLGGVRVYADHGWYTDTDANGMFHLRKLRPGNHLFKVDENTIPPGSKATTPLKQILYVTPGFVGRLSFGISCSFDTVRGELIQTAKAPVDTKSEELEGVVSVTGDARKLSIAVNTRRTKPMSAELV